MSINPSSQKRQILSDPVSVFSMLQPNTDGAEISALKKLRKQLEELNQQCQEVQTQTKIISREIGDAKRNGNPTDELKAAMREQSALLKTITDNLRNTENRILDFFNSGTNTSKPKAKSPQVSQERIYPATELEVSTVTVSLLGDAESEWNSYVDSNPAASTYHRAEWRSLIHKAYGHESYYFIARTSDGRVAGILPLIRLKSRLFGDFLVSMPYFKHGGAVANHPSIEQKLMQVANDHAAALGSSHIEYRDEIQREGLPVRSDKVNMVLALPGTREELWKSFTSKLRAQIRRSQRENPQILFGRQEYLEDFYAVYARNMRDLGSPAHSKRFIQNILDTFPESSWLIVLKLDKKPAAAGFLISNGDSLDIPLASTIRDVNHLSINMLLYWEVLKFAVESGYRYFNFGRSTQGAGTFRFKQQWGARPKPLYWHYWLDNAHELPSLNPSNPKYALMINIWKRLPVTITKWVGPQIVKFLP